MQKTCELGAKYLGLQKELEKVRQELDEEQVKTIRLEKEKIAMEGNLCNLNDLSLCLSIDMKRSLS
mgnify:CR=1 FL=1